MITENNGISGQNQLLIASYYQSNPRLYLCCSKQAIHENLAAGKKTKGKWEEEEGPAQMEGRKGQLRTQGIRRAGPMLLEFLHIHPTRRRTCEVYSVTIFVFTFNPRSKLSFSIFVFTNFGMTYFWKNTLTLSFSLSIGPVYVIQRTTDRDIHVKLCLYVGIYKIPSNLLFSNSH